MHMKHDARSNWASNTIRMHNVQPDSLFRRSDSSLHTYPSLKYCKVRLKPVGDFDGSKKEKLRISQTVHRSEAKQHDYALDESVLEKLLEFELQDKILKDNQVKLQNAKKLRDEQDRKLKKVAEQKRAEEIKAEKDIKAAKITDFINYTGEHDNEKIRTILCANNWDLQKAVSVYLTEKQVKQQNAKKLRDEQNRKLKKEQKRAQEMKVEKDIETAKITDFINYTGEHDNEKIRTILCANDWDLQKAVRFYHGSTEEKTTVPFTSVQISVYIDVKRYEWTFKSNDTLWELYTNVARIKNHAFHFVDPEGRKYKEPTFDSTFADVGWVPSMSLTVCQDL